jgi:peptide subunit release factor RF-3
MESHKGMPGKVMVGKVTNFFSNISVALIELSGGLKEGDRISIEGATTNIQQAADSMQIDRQPIKEARKGDHIGLKTTGRCRPGDVVYRVE